MHEYKDEAMGQDWSGVAGGYCADGIVVDEGGDGEGHTWGTSTWENGRGDEDGGGDGCGERGWLCGDLGCECKEKGTGIGR